MSNCILLIGHTGQGKTTLAKKLLRQTGKASFVFDVNNEFTGERVTDGDIKEYIKRANEKSNTALLIEDATGFLTGKTGEDLRQLVVSKRHKNNTLIFLFHSITDVPPFLYRLCNFIVLFKTADTMREVKEKNPKLLPAWNALQGMPQYSRKFIKNI